MGKIRKIYAAALAMMLCIGTSGAAAEPTLDIADISVDHGLISVEAVNKADAATTFTLTVSKDSGAAGANKYYAVYMQDVTAGGTLLFQFKIPDDKKGIAGSGSYTVHLENYEDQRVSKQFTYADSGDVEAFLNLLQTEAAKVTDGEKAYELLLPVVTASENQDIFFSIGFDYDTFQGKSISVQQQTMNLLYQTGLDTVTVDTLLQALNDAFGMVLYNNGERKEGIILLSPTYNNAAIDEAFIDETIAAMKESYAAVNDLNSDLIVAYGLATIKNANSGIMANTLAVYTNETGLCGEIIGKIAALNPVPERQAYDYIVLGIRNNGLTSNQGLQTLLEGAYASVTSGGTTTGGGSSSGGGGGAIGGKGNSTPVESGSASLGAGVGSGTAEERVEATYLFTDLASNHWAYDSVKWLKNRGIVSGTDVGSFEPDRQVTREEFAKMIVLACGINVENQTADFTDLAKDAWYVPYIGAAADAGIVGGTGNNNFGIGMHITRQDMAVMVKRALDAGMVELVKVKDYIAFEDEGAFAEYATDAIQVLFESGVINGKGNNAFDPTGTATRAEAAKIIYEAFKEVAN